MNIHEFQAKQVFAQFGIPVPKGKEVKNVRAAEKWAAALETSVYVVKHKFMLADAEKPVGSSSPRIAMRFQDLHRS